MLTLLTLLFSLHNATNNAASASTGKSTFTQTLLYDNPNYLDQPTTFPIFIVVLTLTQVGLYFGYLFVTQDFNFQDSDYDSIGGPESMWMMAVEPYPTCKNVHKEVRSDKGRSDELRGGVRGTPAANACTSVV